MKYAIPTIGTVLPAKSNLDENGNPIIPDPGPVQTPNGLDEWLQANAQDQAFKRNAVQAASYLGAEGIFPNWLNQTYPSLADPDAPPPAPPAASIVLVAPAEAQDVDFQVLPSGISSLTGVDGKNYPTGPLIPVCDVPAYTKHPPANNPAGNKIAEKHGHHKK